MRLLVGFIQACLVWGGIPKGSEVITHMHDHWSGRWYRTLSFAQNTLTIDQEGKETKGVWYEALEHPGKLRIDMAPLDQGNGVICVDGAIHRFKGGVSQPIQKTLNPLLVLLGDVYCQRSSRTVSQLQQLGFDLGKAHQAVWEGRSCWVVGAERGDLTANQFWVDTERWLVRRIIHRESGSSAPRDVQVVRFQDVKGYPIASQIHFFQGGRLVFAEDYFDIQVNVALSPSLFDPSAFSRTRVPSAPR